MSAPVPELAAPARAPLGSVREMRVQLSAHRDRPLLVSLYAELLSEDGLLGAAARRRMARTLARSVPAAAALAGAALVVLRRYERAWGPEQVAGVGVLAAALAAVGWRRAAAFRTGRPAGWRESVELGALVVVLAAAAVQGSLRLPLGGASLQPAAYLALAVVVALVPGGAGLALVGFAVALEGAGWWAAGAPPEELSATAARASFAVAFAALPHAVLTARRVVARRADRAAAEQRTRDREERARGLLLLAGADAGEDPERAERAAEAAVLEADGAARGLLEVAQAALGAHTAAAWLLSGDDRELRLWQCRSASQGVLERVPAGDGPLGVVVKRHAAVRWHGEGRAASYYQDGTRPAEVLAVPLLASVGGHLRGVVLADRCSPAPFGDDDERLLSRIAAELARASAAERLIRDGRATRHEQERFYQAMERLNRTAKPRDVFDAVVEVSAGMVPVDFAAVTLVGEGNARDRHTICHARLGAGASASHELEGKEFPDNGGLVSCAVRLGSSLPAKQLPPAELVVFDDATRLKGIASLKVIPLKAGESVLGTLVLGARAAGAYGPDAVRQLEVVAMQAGDSILRARLFEATERLATTDGLTGLVNHRTFQARLDEHLASAQRYGKKVSLLLTDIDHFKAVNDRYGHPSGDVVLKQVARILQKEARTTDVAARYGGEEFALVMPETDRAGAIRTAERIRQKVAQAVFATPGGELTVTLSVGVATFPGDAAGKAVLIERADAGLYHAKRHGRNQTVALGTLRGTK
jgi:diguanylate cyclase (GGDEF)-like protein